MVRLTRIYTRGGDRGETSLGDGSRVPKHAPRVAAFGTVDEANAAIGLARLHANADADAMLSRIQNDLFDLGADLCTPEGGRRGAGALRIAAAQVERLEQEIDTMNASLRPLDSFILPGGSAAAATRSVGLPRGGGSLGVSDGSAQRGAGNANELALTGRNWLMMQRSGRSRPLTTHLAHPQRRGA